MNWMDVAISLFQLINVLILGIVGYCLLLLIIFLRRGIKAFGIYIDKNQEEKK